MLIEITHLYLEMALISHSNSQTRRETLNQNAKARCCNYRETISL